jgi:CBS domain-containing protein
LQLATQINEKELPMTVASLMTKTPACCTPKTKLADVARMMVENDCGQIPVVEDFQTRKLAGVITDRDITTRIVAQGHNSAETHACDCMTSPCITVTPDTSLKSCCELMEENKIRRVPVLDDKGGVVGIVSLADVVRHTNATASAAVLMQVSTDS